MTGSYHPEAPHDFIPDEIREAQQRINPVVLDAYYHQACSDFRADVFKKMFAHQAAIEGTGWATFDLNAEEQGSVAMADGKIDVLVQLTHGVEEREVDGQKVPDITIITNELIVGLNSEQSFLSYVFVLSPNDQAFYGCDAFAGNPKEDGALVSPYKSLFFFNEASRQLTFVFPGGENQQKARDSAVVKHEKKTVRPFGSRNCLEDNFYALRTGRRIFKQIVELEPEHTYQDSIS